MTFKSLPQAVKAGDTLFLNDGIIQIEVSAVKGNEVICRVVVGGELRSRKGLNLPGINLGVSAFTERDHECLKFAAEEGIDAISQSFVETGADIRAVRRAADALGYHPFIIAKIERSNALEHMDDILDAVDGIMIARGDLGVEVPVERIAIIQKDLMRQANRRARPVITATQMLESMTDHRRPTRAEVTDVSNAILDGTDCVMLSGESAMGKYPVEAVEMLAKIAEAVEPRRRPVTVRDLYQGIDIMSQDQTRASDRHGGRSEPRIWLSGRGVRTDVQRCDAPEPFSLQASCMDHRYQLDGVDLSGAGIFLRRSSCLQRGPPKGLYAFCTDLAQGTRNPGGHCRIHGRALPGAS